MTEIVNTSPLASHTDQSSVVDTRPVMIDVDHVSMVFNMASEQLNSLKEYAVAFAKRELMFKEFRAIDDVSFTVRKGDVFGILGTNGSGKSTVLKIITLTWSIRVTSSTTTKEAREDILKATKACTTIEATKASLTTKTIRTIWSVLVIGCTFLVIT